MAKSKYQFCLFFHSLRYINNLTCFFKEKTIFNKKDKENVILLMVFLKYIIIINNFIHHDAMNLTYVLRSY